MPAPKAGAIDQTRRLGEKLERVARIELAHLAWQASRLPLHHTRLLVEMERIELSIPACKTGVFPLALHPHGTGSGGGNRTLASCRAGK